MTNAMLADIAGDSVAKANRDATAKAQKAIIRDCLDGLNGRENAELAASALAAVSGAFLWRRRKTRRSQTR
ncbi:MAG: hypothetical protein R3C54_01560 [Parvularculaceae bacterium]